MRLGGSSEVAAELSISLSRVTALRQHADFPDSIGEIAQGPIWDLDVIAEWGGSSLRRTRAGRPTAEDARRTLGGRFLLECPAIGSGGFADVYRAADKKTGDTVAIKVLRDIENIDDEAVKRFRRELRIMQELSHSNVVPVLSNGKTSEGQIWYAMPLAQGSLSDFASTTELTPPMIVDILRQVCAGLAYVHEHGVYHRDLKPANVLRLSSQDGSTDAWAVSDFGLAVQAERDTDPLTSTYRQGLGSWVYTAPEQWQRARTADHRSDVYSLGKILQELVTGEMPVNAEMPVSVLRPVVERAVANAPDSRYQSVGDFVEAMERAVGARATHASWETREQQAERLRDRLLSRPGGDDLIQVVEWGLTLDEDSGEDMASLVRVLPWMDLASIKWLWEWDGSAFGRVIQRFTEHVGAGSFSFEYCDTLANFLRRVARGTQDPKALGQVVRALARLGTHHNRWHVRDVLVEVLQDIKSEEAASEAVEALRSIPPDELRWSITDFTIRSLPAAVRAGVGPLVATSS